MRSAVKALAAVTALALLVSCSNGGKAEKPSAGTSPTGYVATGTWDAAYMKTLRGLAGSFRSLVVGAPCTEPITRTCVVGGAQISDAGVFTTGPNGARYEHRAVGLNADVTEAGGYRTLLVPNGDDFISVMGRSNRGGCWAPLMSVPEFGSQWSPMPVGFDILLNADAVDDPPVGSKTRRFGGLADVDLVLKFLGLQKLYDVVIHHYAWKDTRVPIELRVGADGLPSGFAVDGKQVAESLVGPDPEANTNAPAALMDDASDKLWDADVRDALTPMRGEFSVFDLGTEPSLKPPPKNRLLTHRAVGNDPCPAGR